MAGHVPAVVAGCLGQDIQLLELGQTVILAGLVDHLAYCSFLPGEHNSAGAVAGIRNWG